MIRKKCGLENIKVITVMLEQKRATFSTTDNRWKRNESRYGKRSVKSDRGKIIVLTKGKKRKLIRRLIKLIS